MKADLSRLLLWLALLSTALWTMMIVVVVHGLQSSSSSSLQTFHVPPTQTLRDVLAKIEELEEQQQQLLGSQKGGEGGEEKIVVENPWDTYGDYDVPNVDGSLLRRFERQIATLLGKDDAVCMPSGTMAQSIALRIHEKSRRRKDESIPSRSSAFACHPTCHLLLHEQDAYAELLGMSAVVVTNGHHDDDDASLLSIPPLLYDDVVRTLNEYKKKNEIILSNNDDHDEHQLHDAKKPPHNDISTLILELPHREIGGQLTPWEDVCRMQAYCQEHDMAFHCDGARFFEASVGGYEHSSLKMTAAPFDSIYLSLYKGLGGFAGSILVGSTDFCRQARIWLTRYGGNLHTLAPYVIAGQIGLDRYYHGATAAKSPPGGGGDGASYFFSFRELKEKLQAIVASLQQDPDVARIVTFHPATPQTNMVHGYFRVPASVCHAAVARAERKTSIKVLHRIRDLSEIDMAYRHGYRAKFEWTLGQVNSAVDVTVVQAAWKSFAQELFKAMNHDNGVVE
jgi:threonine aldolase